MKRNQQTKTRKIHNPTKKSRLIKPIPRNSHLRISIPFSLPTEGTPQFLYTHKIRSQDLVLYKLFFLAKVKLKSNRDLERDHPVNRQIRLEGDLIVYSF